MRDLHHADLEQDRLGFRWDLTVIRPLRQQAYADAVALRTPNPPADRYSFAPVARLAQLRGLTTITEIAVWLGCSREQIYRLQRPSGMSWMVADRIATYLNMHPTAIWPDWALDLEAAS